jgi:hypothetical protein
MLDHTFLSARREGNNINLDDEEGVLGWCEAFGCTLVELRQAVAAVGPDVATVYQYIQSLK